MEKRIQIGCIADDFTGASDAASFLCAQGMKTYLFNGIPETEFSEECDAIVIAMKTRTASRKEAEDTSVKALKWLREVGAEKLYVKYCSTFDSTRTGNIGPVMDAALEALKQPYTVLCPSLPVNGRTVKGGCLYVNGIPLHETHMKDHPLTPMWASDISVLMQEQSSYPCFIVSIDEMQRGKESLLGRIREWEKTYAHFYLVPDFYEAEHADLILSCFGHLELLSGGSGLLGADIWKQSGKTLLLAGSCSSATLEQIETYKNAGGQFLKIDPLKLLQGETSEDIWKEIEGADGILCYSSDTAEKVKMVQKEGKQTIAGLIEQTFSELAVRAVENGYTQIITAGGETSGAVTKALGFDAYLIGESIAPGVPVMIPVKNRNLRLVLKSGNFGQRDFFARAMRMTTTGRRGE